MNVSVRLFSVLREHAGRDRLIVDVPADANVAAVVAAVRVALPPLGQLLDATQGLPLLVAVNREYASPDAQVRDGDEVALLPPVSGGAPLPQGLLLLSGGFDSPVAGHLVLRSGRTLDAVHFTMEPFSDDASAHKARRLAATLGLRRLVIVPLGDDLAEFTRRCDHKYYFVLLKRLMLRVAQEVARSCDASFLVTGENLGQVSSQTLSNMAVIDSASRLPILRPLLGLDKNDIIAIAHRISTYETSKGPELCDLLGPAHPATFSRLEDVEAEEAKVDLPALVRNALSKAQTEVLPAIPTVAP